MDKIFNMQADPASELKINKTGQFFVPESGFYDYLKTYVISTVSFFILFEIIHIVFSKLDLPIFSSKDRS